MRGHLFAGHPEDDPSQLSGPSDAQPGGVIKKKSKYAPIAGDLHRNGALPGILSGVWCCDTISKPVLRTCISLFGTVSPCQLFGGDCKVLTPRWRFIRLFDHHHSFTNCLPLRSLQSKGHRLARFCRGDIGSFLLHALDRGLKIISVGIRTHPERDRSQE